MRRVHLVRGGTRRVHLVQEGGTRRVHLVRGEWGGGGNPIQKAQRAAGEAPATMGRQDPVSETGASERGERPTQGCREGARLVIEPSAVQDQCLQEPRAYGERGAERLALRVRERHVAEVEEGHAGQEPPPHLRPPVGARLGQTRRAQSG
jgi:hypothetical protein